MALGRKRQASQPPSTRSKKPKTSTKCSTTRSEAAAEAALSSDRDVQRTDEGDRIVVNDDELLISADTKTDEWATTFRAIIDEKEQEIVDQLEKRKAAMSASLSPSIPVLLATNHRIYSDNEIETLQSQMLPILSQSLLPIDADDTPIDRKIKTPIQHKPESSPSPLIDVAFTTVDGQLPCRHIWEVVANCERLLNIYGNLLDLEASSPHASRLPTLRSDFEKDKEATLAVLAAGKHVAIADVQGMLMDRYDEVRGGKELGKEEEKKGRLLLAKGTEKEGQTRNGTKAEHIGTDELAEGGEAGGVEVLMGWGNLASGVREAIERLDDVVGDR